MSDNQVKAYPLRLMPLLRSKLEEVAKSYGRSLNTEIAMRLENSFTTEEEDEEERIKKIVNKILDDKAKNSQK